ncbi:hypothetical protein CEXT_283081 [Caerostris extrusa]|uniref:Uncharacterized protein n=1 Tax=Caerostris extrusa TaxID=172846 RepID=A0AAV4Y761_CAEEX|nr:hypothetical protein CEXT_283081 [Caerostris extrusa]
MVNRQLFQYYSECSTEGMLYFIHAFLQRLLKNISEISSRAKYAKYKCIQFRHNPEEGASSWVTQCHFGRREKFTTLAGTLRTQVECAIMGVEQTIVSPVNDGGYFANIPLGLA